MTTNTPQLIDHTPLKKKVGPTDQKNSQMAPTTEARR